MHSRTYISNIARCRGKELVVDESHPDYVLMDKMQTGPEGERAGMALRTEYGEFPVGVDSEGHMEVVFEDDVYIAYQVRE